MKLLFSILTVLTGDMSQIQNQVNNNLVNILLEMKKMNATNASLLSLIEKQNTLIKEQGDILAKVAEVSANSTSVLKSVITKTGYSDAMIRTCS